MEGNELQAGAYGHVWCYVGLEAAQQDNIEFSVLCAAKGLETSSSKLVGRSGGGGGEVLSPLETLFAVDERDVLSDDVTTSGNRPFLEIRSKK